MSFPKRITSNLKRSLTINSPKDKNRRLHQTTNNNNNNNNNDNNNGKLNRQQSTPQQTPSCRSPTKSSNPFTFKMINNTASHSDQGIRRKMDEGSLSDRDVVDTTRLMTSTTNMRTRGRRRKRSNTIDVGALLEFRSTVRKESHLRSFLVKEVIYFGPRIISLNEFISTFKEIIKVVDTKPHFIKKRVSLTIFARSLTIEIMI